MISSSLPTLIANDICKGYYDSGCLAKYKDLIYKTINASTYGFQLGCGGSPPLPIRINFLKNNKIICECSTYTGYSDNTPIFRDQNCTIFDIPYSEIPVFFVNIFEITISEASKTQCSTQHIIDIVHNFAVNLCKSNIFIEDLKTSMSEELEREKLENSLSKQQEDYDLKIQSLQASLLKQQEDKDLEIKELKQQNKKKDLKIKKINTLLSKQKEDYDLKILEQKENKTKIISVEDISKSDKSFDVDNLKDIISEHYKEIHLLKNLLSKQNEGSDFKTLLLKQQEEKDLKSLLFKRYEENKRKIISVEDIQKSEFDIDKIKDVITKHYKEINLLKAMYGNT